MLKLGLVVAAAFVLQILLGMMQMKHFSDEFVKLRRCGRVACGRKAGGFYAGAIVMFLIDDEGYIKKEYEQKEKWFYANRTISYHSINAINFRNCNYKFGKCK